MSLAGSAGTPLARSAPLPFGQRSQAAACRHRGRAPSYRPGTRSGTGDTAPLSSGSCCAPGATPRPSSRVRTRGWCCGAAASNHLPGRLQPAARRDDTGANPHSFGSRANGTDTDLKADPGAPCSEFREPGRAGRPRSPQRLFLSGHGWRSSRDRAATKLPFRVLLVSSLFPLFFSQISL